MATHTLRWDDGKDRVINNLGITTKVRNRVDGRVYWIGTMRPLFGSILERWYARTRVVPNGLCGAPDKDNVLLQVDAFSQDELMAVHVALEDMVANEPRGTWATALPRVRAETARDPRPPRR
ncbi:MAG TPA: hypothetical protein VEZ44_11105 [bacterium]|nr:hypothetical protein [bacterium]